jgi:hypothetical protein
VAKIGGNFACQARGLKFRFEILFVAEILDSCSILKKNAAQIEPHLNLYFSKNDY